MILSQSLLHFFSRSFVEGEPFVLQQMFRMLTFLAGNVNFQILCFDAILVESNFWAINSWDLFPLYGLMKTVLLRHNCGGIDQSRKKLNADGKKFAPKVGVCPVRLFRSGGSYKWGLSKYVVTFGSWRHEQKWTNFFILLVVYIYWSRDVSTCIIKYIYSSRDVSTCIYRLRGLTHVFFCFG